MRTPLYASVRFAGIALVLLVLVSGCFDGRDVLLPRQDSSALQSVNDVITPVRLEGSAQAAAGRRTLRDEFTGMAQRVPGGFGGLYFDDDGVLSILLVQPDQHVQAKEALSHEEFIQARSAADGTVFDIRTARVLEARYAHDRLHAWLDGLLPALWAENIRPTKHGVSVRRNSILIGLRDAADQPDVERAAEPLGIPGDAVIVEPVPPLELLSTVHDRIRPVPAGTQVTYSGNLRCSLGPNMVREPSGHPPEPGYLIPSHCSEHPFVSFFEEPDPITFYFQAVDDGSDANHIGNKGVDPELFACQEDPNGLCRNSDAAQGLYYTGNASGEFGYIARPASRNDDTYDIDPINPRFEIVGTFPWTISGETMEKVGRATGWSGGQDR